MSGEGPDYPQAEESGALLPDDRESVLVVEVSDCQRCGGTHGVHCTEFREPLRLGGRAFPFWGFCPESGDPMFFGGAEDPDA